LGIAALNAMIMKYLFFSTFTFAQQTQFVDFKSVQGKIAVNSIEKQFQEIL
jgi:hypothetical protein